MTWLADDDSAGSGEVVGCGEDSVGTVDCYLKVK